MSFDVSEVGNFSTEGPTRLTALSIVDSTGLLLKSNEERWDQSSTVRKSTKSTILAGVTLNGRPCIAVFEVAWKKIATESQLESSGDGGGGNDGGGGSSSTSKSSGKISGGGGTTKKVLPAPIVLQATSVGFVSFYLVKE